MPIVCKKPAVILPTETHTATVIFLHGMGFTGDIWESKFQKIREPHIKYICPHAPVRQVTVSSTMETAWYDIFGVSFESGEDDQGINEGAQYVHSLIEAEMSAGIEPDRIVIGGFSMGGSLALFSALTLDEPLAGVIALSAYFVQRHKFPAALREINRDVAVFQCHGENDRTVFPNYAHATAKFLKMFNCNHQLKTYADMAHCVCDQELQDVKEFIAQQLPADYD